MKNSNNIKENEDLITKLNSIVKENNNINNKLNNDKKDLNKEITKQKK